MTRTTRPRKPARNRPRFETLESRALLSLAGGIDQSFGTLGIVNNPVVPVANQSKLINSQGVESTIAPDGTIVQASSYEVGGGAGYDVIEELNPDGTLKTSFGQNGIATFQVDTDGSAIVSAVVVQANGTIDVAGSFGVQAGNSSIPQEGILEVTPAGTLETSFGNQGMALLPASLTVAGGVLPQIGAMAVDSSGDLILAGSDGDGLFFATRYTPAGTIDTTFGTNGVASFPVAISTTISEGYHNQVVSIAIQSSGRILIAGNAIGTSAFGDGRPNTNVVYSETVVAALTTSGTLDTTFGDGTNPGEEILKPTDNVSLKSVAAMALQSTGLIVLAGTSGPGATLPQTGAPQTGFLERLRGSLESKGLWRNSFWFGHNLT